MSSDLLYQIALTLIPQIGPVQAKILLQHCEPEEVFHAKTYWLEKVEGIGSIRAEAIRKFKDFARAEEELRFIEKNGIRALFLTDPAYPRRLLNCYDSPTLLYYKGEADLNASRMLAIIGTRNHTDYGKQVTDKLVTALASHEVSIVSGLAFGIDALAHRSAIRNNLPTVAVLGHGLDQVYPPDHGPLARDILQFHGGILTEFRMRSKPDRHNFPSRNRVVAGMTDATLVIETDMKGGSMITADLANSYNRDVFALPGRTTDARSAGCNHLIKNNKAVLLTDAEQLLDTMGWAPRKKASPKPQRELFIELSPEERTILDCLKEKELTHIDELRAGSGLSSSMIAAAILNLELQNVIVSLPGNLFRLS